MSPRVVKTAVAEQLALFGVAPRPETFTVVLADTRLELPPLMNSALRLMEEAREPLATDPFEENGQLNFLVEDEGDEAEERLVTLGARRG